MQLKSVYRPLMVLAAFSLMNAVQAEDKSDMVDISIQLPKPAYIGTPKEAPKGRNVEIPTGKPPAPFKAPKGTTNLAKGKKVTSSDPEPIIGQLPQLTDGEKTAQDGNYVELATGLQWVQVDLEKEADIYAIAFWHNFMDPRVYLAVNVQVSNDPQFKKDVTTVYNNDFENKNGMGVGKDKEYFETHEGHVIRLPSPAKGRYVRFYSNGSTADDQNQYIELEVWGVAK